MKNKECRIVIVEPSEIIVSGLQKIIDVTSEFSLVGFFSDINNALGRIDALKADIVIVNPTLMEFHKRGALKSIFPDTKIVALLYNYVDKDIIDQFQEVIDIYDKPSKVVQKLNKVCTESLHDTYASNVYELSDREKDILIAVSKGLINKEIASLHNISIHTVISHRKNISRKIGIKSVSGFVVYALLNNLLDEHEIK